MAKPPDTSWKKNAQAKQRAYARGPIKRLAVPERMPKAKRDGAALHGGGRPAARRVAKTAVRLEMQAQIWRMLVEGAARADPIGFREIGLKVGCSGTTAWRYALAYANRRNSGIVDDVKTFRTLQWDRVQALIEAHWKSKGKKASADVILRAMEREAKLLGLDKEPDVGVYSGAQVKSMLQGLFSLFVQLVEDIELRRQFALGIRRQLPSAVKTTPEGETVIDVDPPDDLDMAEEPEDE